MWPLVTPASAVRTGLTADLSVAMAAAAVMVGPRWAAGSRMRPALSTCRIPRSWQTRRSAARAARRSWRLQPGWSRHGPRCRSRRRRRRSSGTSGAGAPAAPAAPSRGGGVFNAAGAQDHGIRYDILGQPGLGREWRRRWAGQHRAGGAGGPGNGERGGSGGDGFGGAGGSGGSSGSGDGGGVFNLGTVSLSGKATTFSDNQASGGSGGIGGFGGDSDGGPGNTAGGSGGTGNGGTGGHGGAGLEGSGGGLANGPAALFTSTSAMIFAGNQAKGGRGGAMAVQVAPRSGAMVARSGRDRRRPGPRRRRRRWRCRRRWRRWLRRWPEQFDRRHHFDQSTQELTVTRRQLVYGQWRQWRQRRRGRSCRVRQRRPRRQWRRQRQ